MREKYQRDSYHGLLAIGMRQISSNHGKGKRWKSCGNGEEKKNLSFFVYEKGVRNSDESDGTTEKHLKYQMYLNISR